MLSLQLSVKLGEEHGRTEAVVPRWVNTLAPDAIRKTPDRRQKNCGEKNKSKTRLATDFHSPFFCPGNKRLLRGGGGFGGVFAAVGVIVVGAVAVTRAAAAGEEIEDNAGERGF